MLAPQRFDFAEVPLALLERLRQRVVALGHDRLALLTEIGRRARVLFAERRESRERLVAFVQGVRVLRGTFLGFAPPVGGQDIDTGQRFVAFFREKSALLRELLDA